ncbi:MAG: hypothetical protein ABJL99_06850 [Aliishimia sp.]
MSSLRTLKIALVVSTLVGGPVLAQSNIALVFAGCVGRMSAEMEHAWLLGDPEADRHKALRSTFLTLLDATMPAGTGRDMLNHRIDVKLAHSSLLTTARFESDVERANAAKSIAVRHVSTCRKMLLDS